MLIHEIYLIAAKLLRYRSNYSTYIQYNQAIKCSKFRTNGEVMEQGLKSSKEIGNSIRKIRKQEGMTQGQLAAKLQVRGCDISRGTLAKIEAGIRHISVEELNAIKAVLKVTYKELLS